MAGFSRWLARHSGDNRCLPTASNEDAAASRTIYKPLRPGKREIRVLKLEPGAGHEELTASLIATKVPVATRSDSKPRPRAGRKGVAYEAISYCWRDPNERATVILNGVSISAPRSAVLALQSFRLPDRPRILWIDALCINQQDNNERSQQVGMMGDVYSNAIQTLVHLDTAIDEAKVQHAFGLLERIRDRFVGEDGTAWIHEFYQSKGFQGMRERALKVRLEDDDNLGLLNVLFEHPWFHRLWIWQEALLAPQCLFYMGSHSTTWEAVVACTVWSAHTGYGVASHDQPQIPQERLPSYFSRMSMSVPSTLILDDIIDQRFDRPGYTLGYLLSMTSHCQTTDPKDRVYALLGLSLSPGVELHSNIRPDYHRSTRDCMRDATRYIIADSGRLSILNDIRLSAETHEFDEPGTPPWPSWVPVWCSDGSKYFISELNTGAYAADDDYLADKSLAFSDADKDVLQLKGNTVDSVTDVIHLNEEMFATIKSLQRLLELVNQSAREPSLSLSELALILSVGTFYDSRVTLDDSRIQSFDLMAESISTGTSATYQVQYDSTFILRRLIYKCRGKVLFRTKASRFGVGLAAMQAGDAINILYGGTWMFALREQGDEYRLIGSCYVHGIMDGEAVKECNERGEKPVIFKIR